MQLLESDNSNMKLMNRQELRGEEKNIVNGCMEKENWGGKGVRE